MLQLKRHQRMASGVQGGLTGVAGAPAWKLQFQKFNLLIHSGTIRYQATDLGPKYLISIRERPVQGSKRGKRPSYLRDGPRASSLPSLSTALRLGKGRGSTRGPSCGCACLWGSQDKAGYLGNTLQCQGNPNTDKWSHVCWRELS